MSQRDFLTTVAIVLLCLITANGAMAWWSTQLPPIRKLDMIDAGRNANVLLLGNSLMEFSADPELFNQTARLQSRNLVAVNAALTATFAIEQYLLFEQAVQNPLIHTVIVGIFDFQCSARYRLDVSALLGYRAFAFDSRVPVRDVESIYEFPFMERVRFRLFRMFPLLAYRTVAWEPVERVKNLWDDPSVGFDEGIERGFKGELEAFGKVPVHFNPPMERIVQESQARGYRVMFVLMPVSPRHITNCYKQPRWGPYLASLKELIKGRRCGFVDASEWFPSQSYFRDSVHLKFGSGGRLFSPALAKATIAELSAMDSRWPK